MALSKSKNLIHLHPIMALCKRAVQFAGEHNERFLKKVIKTESCWLWGGSKDRAGYGRFRIGRNTCSAHRTSYEIHGGKIPPGLFIDHLCRNPSCVNPDHLEPVTHKENMQRSAPATKKFCNHGHPRSAETLYFIKRKDGKQQTDCKKCRAERYKKSKAQKAALNNG